jgi:hypothetical protein
MFPTSGIQSEHEPSRHLADNEIIWDSRPTGYLWLERYREHGVLGLKIKRRLRLLAVQRWAEALR